MPISLILTPFDYFQIHPSFAVTPNLILEPCHIDILICHVSQTMMIILWIFTMDHHHEAQRTQFPKDSMLDLFKSGFRAVSIFNPN